jgi:hypothetical protein
MWITLWAIGVMPDFPIQFYGLVVLCLFFPGKSPDSLFVNFELRIVLV